MKDYIMQLDALVHNRGFIVFLLSVADIITGYCKAKYVNKDFKSAIMKKGIITHFMIVCGVIMAQIYAPDFNLSPVVDAFTLGVIVMLLNSLKENFIELGGDPTIFKAFERKDKTKDDK